MEKVFIAFDLLAIGLVIYQLYVYHKSHNIPFNDGRIITFILSLMSGIYIFVHYGLINARARGKYYFLIELSRFINLYSLCYYYSNKASGLIKNKNRLVKFLQIYSVISILGYLYIIISL